MAIKRLQDLDSLRAQLTALDAWEKGKKELEQIYDQRERSISGSMKGKPYTAADLAQMEADHQKYLNDTRAAIKEKQNLKVSGEAPSEKTLKSFCKVIAVCVIAWIAYSHYKMMQWPSVPGYVYLILGIATGSFAWYLFWRFIPEKIAPILRRRYAKKLDGEILALEKQIEIRCKTHQNSIKNLKENQKVAESAGASFETRIAEKEKEIEELRSKYRAVYVVPIQPEERADLVAFIKILEDGRAESISEAIRLHRANK